MKREEWIFVEQNDRPRLKLVKGCTPVHVLPPCSLLLDIHVAILIAFDMLALEGATLNIDTTGAGRKKHRREYVLSSIQSHPCPS